MKNTKILFAGLIILCFSMGLFAQSNTYINGWDTFNLVFTTNNIQRIEIFKNGKIQMAPLVDGNKGLVTFDSSGNIRPLDFNGNAGTVLTGNGTFTNVSSISLWQQAGSNIYFTGGNVGIGTTDPHYPLQIVGNVVDSGNFFATNIATFNSISVGQFKLVAGVVDSIVTTSGTLQLSATTINADGTLTAAQSLTAGTTDTAITINGRTGTITSPLKTIGFGNDTLTTTGAIKASYFKADSIQLSQINPKDSVIYFGDPVALMTLPKNPGPPLSGDCFLPVYMQSKSEAWAFGGYPLFNSIRFGIGTKCPQAILDVEGVSDGTPGLIVDSGNVGIGTKTPAELLDVNGNALVRGTLVVDDTISPVINTPTGYGLYVGKGILTEKVKIAVHTDGTTWSWPDYVLGTKYNLTPLNELEKYIAANNHLPDVPSVNDVKKDGIDVATMDATLLKKVEELTLYILQQQKQINQQKQKMDELQEKVDSLSKTNK